MRENVIATHTGNEAYETLMHGSVHLSQTLTHDQKLLVRRQLFIVQHNI